MNTVRKGKRGEEIAEDYLIKHNYRIIRQNYYTRWGELDIISWDSQAQELVFVEVKARASRRYGYPEDAIDKRKLERMIMTAENYLTRAGYAGPYRFDCLAIELDYNKRGVSIKHFKNMGL